MLLAGLQSSFHAGHAFAVGVGFQMVCCAERVSFGSGLPNSFKCFRCNSSLWEKKKKSEVVFGLVLV